MFYTIPIQKNQGKPKPPLELLENPKSKQKSTRKYYSFQGSAASRSLLWFLKVDNLWLLKVDGLCLLKVDDLWFLKADDLWFLKVDDLCFLKADHLWFLKADDLCFLKQQNTPDVFKLFILTKSSFDALYGLLGPDLSRVVEAKSNILL